MTGKVLLLVRAGWIGIAASIVLAFAGPVFAQPVARARARPAVNNDAGAATAAYMRTLGSDRAALRLFLQAMPKGGDLHNHLGGAIYAEDLLRWAADGGLCVTGVPVRIVAAPCAAPDSTPVAALADDPVLYSRAIDALSTRGFELGTTDPAVSGADRFFSTFGGFEAAYVGNVDKALAVARAQAADDNVQYLELQVGPGALTPFLPADWAAGVRPDDFATLAGRLAQPVARAVAAARADYDAIVAGADTIQHCGASSRGGPPRPGTPPDAGCRVAIRFQMTAVRTLPPADVFAQLAFGFALVAADPRFVGVNILAPEHDPVALRDYRLHMAMLAFLKARAPAVPLSLHAGELTLGLVPPRDLRFHIHDAVMVAGARRIGHGVDIAYEADAAALLARMARDRVAVEVNLTSNAVILGVVGKAHPLALYRAAGVPVVLSTDDEGVSRTDMTNEYLRAATEQGLDYAALKRIARDSVTYAFLPGDSLWRDAGARGRVAPCVARLDDPGCIAFARGSARAATQVALEQAFDTFERRFVPAMKTTLAAGTPARAVAGGPVTSP